MSTTYRLKRVSVGNYSANPMIVCEDEGYVPVLVELQDVTTGETVIGQACFDPSVETCHDPGGLATVINTAWQLDDDPCS